MLSVGSFVFGVALSLMLFGSHTSTLLQPRSSWADAIKIEGAEPVVPPLIGVFEDFGISGGQQALDGFNCKNCRFHNVMLTYSGGAFRLVNASFSGTTRLTFKGAAANTITALALVQAIEYGKPKLVESPATIKTVTAKQPLTMDWISPK